MFSSHMHLALPKCLLPPHIPVNSWYAFLCHVCQVPNQVEENYEIPEEQT